MVLYLLYHKKYKKSTSLYIYIYFLLIINNFIFIYYIYKKISEHSIKICRTLYILYINILHISLLLVCQKVNYILEIAQKLTEFNSIIFEKSNEISIDEIKDIFIEYSNILAKKNNISQDEFIKLVKTKIYAE